MDGVRAVLFDLDDTLFPHDAWSEGMWDALAGAAAAHGVEPGALLRTLRAATSRDAEGAEAVEHALDCADHAGISVAPLLDVLHRFRSPTLAPYPWVPNALARLRADVRIGLVTDGDPRVQRGKLDALGLGDAFDVVVFSDELGREFRKPHPMPFRLALTRLDVAPEHAVMVGDRPDLDVAGAAAAGIRAIRVRTGAHACTRDVPGTWRSLPDVLSAVDVLCCSAGATGTADVAAVAARRGTSAALASADAARAGRADSPRIGSAAA
jgi:putative hydrolase of the HAD superfamily